MTSPSAEPYVSFEDFLSAESSSETKHEWVDGVVYAMAGGSVEHGRLATKMTAALTLKLGGRCTVLSSDVMVYVRETDLATFPDGGVLCGAMDVAASRTKRNMGRGNARDMPAVRSTYLLDIRARLDGWRSLARSD